MHDKMKPKKDHSYIIFMLYEFFSILPWRIGYPGIINIISLILFTIPYFRYRQKVLKQRKLNKIKMGISLEIISSTICNIVLVLCFDSIDTIPSFLLQMLAIAPTLIFETIFDFKKMKE